ncbi:MAG: hypothetical protein KatS3mg023_2641 [Armatimonadota bacterium]|nr:MAG: hypothetical protein KatS3mg023_2641 [Armatimonadota bacterium]
MIHRIGWLLVVLGTAVSLLAFGARWRAESLNRRVGIVLDGEQLFHISADTGIGWAQTLSPMKQAGATAVALEEQSVEDLFRAGQLTWELYPRFPSPIVRAASVQVVERLRQAVGSIHTTPSLWRTVYTPSRKKLLDTLRAKGGVLVYAYTDTGGAVGFSVPVSPAAFQQLRAGIDPVLARQVVAAGLSVVARVGNSPACTPLYIQRTLEGARRVGAKVVVFSGDEVLGFRALLSRTAEEMRRQGMLYGSVEFGKQKGDERLTRLLLDRVVRVHSVPAAEMSTLSPGELRERYTRAVRERNIRLCYVRLPSSLEEQPLQGAARFVAQLRLSLQEAGYRVGEPHPFTDPKVPAWVWWIAGGSALVAGLLLLERLFALRRSGWLALGAFALGLALAYTGGETGRKACALAAAVAFPSLGFVLTNVLRSARSPVLYALGVFAGVTLFSLAGGLHVVALLASLPFLVKANQFAGIKLAHLLPVLAVGWAYALDTVNATSFADARQRIRERWQRIVSHPVTVGLATAVFVALILLALVLMRTGNEPGVGVSDMEMKMRMMLERYLLARPRTKEFLVGHPALVLALAMSAAGIGRAVWVPLLLVGVIGQASVVNTLCHIHTPLALSVPRILLGWLLGAIIGTLAFVAIRWWTRRMQA